MSPARRASRKAPKMPLAPRGSAKPIDALALLRRSDPRGPARTARALKPFASGEHVWLGDNGAAEACKQARGAGMDVSDATFASLTRLAGNDTFSYGELVALSGDFYGSPSELYEEKPSSLPWLWESNDISDLRESFEKELRWIRERQRGRGTLAYPDENIRMAWNAKSYVELALKNVDHFGWHNMVAYCRHHAAALRLAAHAGGKDGEPWRRAVVYNAFADHFLSDGFAAGHVRVPRAEIRSWAEARGLSEKLAGSLSKLLHDADGHVETLHGSAEAVRKTGDGLRVKNANGDAWETFCDGQLFLFPGSTDSPAVRLPVAAIAASVLELVTAWKKGTLPDGLFTPSRLVAFPHPDSPGLADKFSKLPEQDVARLFKASAWYQKIPWIGPGMKLGHVRDLFAALPDLMQRLRASVDSDLAHDADLRRQLAPEYLAAYRGVQ